MKLTFVSWVISASEIFARNKELIILIFHSFFFINFPDSIHWVMSLGDEFIKESFVFIL